MRFSALEIARLVRAETNAATIGKLERLFGKNIVLLDNEMALAHWRAMDGALSIAREQGMERFHFAMESARLVEEQLRPVAERLSRRAGARTLAGVARGGARKGES